jgi:ABC-type Mn2+/Zn2+ transport system permease subunit
MSETFSLLSQGFVQDALKAALIVSVLCSFLGVFVVLKRIVFVGAALAEVSALGAAVAFFPPAVTALEGLGPRFPALGPEHYEHTVPVAFAFLFMLLAVVVFSQQGLVRRLPREAIIGATFAGAAGLTTLVLSKNASGSEHAMDALNGNILGVLAGDIQGLAVAGALVSLVQALFYKEFVLVAFDPEVARTLGYRSGLWELVWYLTLGIMIAISIHVAGTVLVFAYLVLPPVTALLLSRRLGVVFFLSVLIGITATFGGVLLSVSPADLPTSPTIVGCMVLFLAVCWLGAKLFTLGGQKSLPRVGTQGVSDRTGVTDE